MKPLQSSVVGVVVKSTKVRSVTVVSFTKSTDVVFVCFTLIGTHVHYKLVDLLCVLLHFSDLGFTSPLLVHDHSKFIVTIKPDNNRVLNQYEPW